jgi:hypothetical protein
MLREAILNTSLSILGPPKDKEPNVPGVLLILSELVVLAPLISGVNFAALSREKYLLDIVSHNQVDKVADKL